jgi:hypothetical protein
MRAAIVSWLLLAGCNSLLGNGNFRGPDARNDCMGRGLPPTALSGTVFAPNGSLPIDHALVYVPTTPLADIPEGVSGPTCASGSPVVTVFSDARGKFQLQDVPPGTDVPLVIQVGKWRRAVTVPSVPECAETAVDAGLTRLPRDSTEGHIPHIAITTGISDTLECVARDLGLADSEVGWGTASTARVQLYAGNGTARTATAEFEPASALLNATALPRYDAVMIGCEGSPAKTTLAGAQALFDFTNRGGWLWVTHFEFPWLQQAPAPWSTIGTFNSANVTPVNPTILIDQDAPRGHELADWSVATGLSAVPGSVTLQYIRSSGMTADPAITHSIMHLDPAGGLTGVQMFTWDAAMGGRMVYSDVHLSGTTGGAVAYPGECMSMPPAQEKAILFEMFDMPTCLN